MAVRFNSASKLPVMLAGALVAGSALAQTTTPVAPPPGDVFAINAGGVATQGYSADADFTLGSTYTNISQPVYVQDVNNAAPAAVYSTEREGEHFSYTFSGLKPGIGYVVILHFAELYWAYPGQREFNVDINGARVLTNFDIVAQAGFPFHAVVRFFTVRADANGVFKISFTRGAVDQPLVNAIEIRGNAG